MKPILYEEGTTTFNTNGLGRLADAISCPVTEARNGAFELVLKYPVNGIHRAEITKGRILYCIHDDTKTPQPFDIYKVVEESKGTISVYARHIAYRLQKFTVMPFAFIGEGAQDMLDFMRDNMVPACPFTFYSDVIAQDPTETVKSPLYPVSAWSMLGDDSEDHVLYSFPGEWKYDGFNISLLAARGTDGGIKIRRGKNATNIKATTDISEQLTGVVPYWTGTDLDTGDGVTVVDYDNPIVYASDAPLFPVQQVEPLDLTDMFETRPTVAEVKAAAQAWLSRYVINNRGNVNYDVDLTNMQDLPEALKLVKLCDIVTLEDAVLGFSRKVKVVKTVYDAVKEQLTKIEVGSPKKPLSYVMKFAGSGDVTNNLASTSATGATSGNTVKQTKTNAVKIKALENAVAALNSGGGGDFNGKIGGPNNSYGTLKQYDNNGDEAAVHGITSNYKGPGSMIFTTLENGETVSWLRIFPESTYPGQGHVLRLGHSPYRPTQAYTYGPSVGYNQLINGRAKINIQVGPDIADFAGAEAGTAITVPEKQVFAVSYGDSDTTNILRTDAKIWRNADGEGGTETNTYIGDRVRVGGSYRDMIRLKRVKGVDTNGDAVNDSELEIGWGYYDPTVQGNIRRSKTTFRGEVDFSQAKMTQGWTDEIVMVDQQTGFYYTVTIQDGELTVTPREA